VKPIRQKTSTNRTLNILNLLLSVLVFGTGLVLLTQFHIGGSPYQTEWLGLGKQFWLDVHRASAIGFLAGFVAHMLMHWKFIKTLAGRWRTLPQKI